MPGVIGALPFAILCGRRVQFKDRVLGRRKKNMSVCVCREGWGGNVVLAGLSSSQDPPESQGRESPSMSCRLAAGRVGWRVGNAWALVFGP